MHSLTYLVQVKGLVVELTPSHTQSAWGSRGERVQAAGLAACCNYLLKKKKKTYLVQRLKNLNE